jgi:hypothetical protein
MARAHTVLLRLALMIIGIAGLLMAGQDASTQDVTLPQPIPIPQQPLAQPVPDFVGNPATPNPINARAIPQSPYMAPNGVSSVHLDAYQSDTYTFSGPLGRGPQVTSTFLAGLCGTVTFDFRGRIVAVCVGPSVIGPILYMLDPVTLQTITTLKLPASGGNGEFGAGGYFFLDNNYRAVIPTRTGDIWRVKEVETSSGTTFALDHTCASDLPAFVGPTQEILSAFPDAKGLLWFTTSGDPNDPQTTPASVGTLVPDPTIPDKCTLKSFTLPSGERINKSFAVDPDRARGGVFIVYDPQLYRFDALSDGTPQVTWQEVYDRGTGIKPGQRVQGSGTTPTLMGTDLVTIDDNASPQIHVNVYRRGKNVSGQRLICSEPVFQPGMSDSFNSPIATEKSIIIENNYGYESPLNTIFGGTTTPGITRIDIGSDRSSCSTVWTNNDESVPNVVSQASLATGLEYTYSKDPSPPNAPTTDPWYFTAVDFRTGKTIFKVLAGTGVLFNSHYSSVYLGPDGRTGYVGVLGGLVRISDTY